MSSFFSSLLQSALSCLHKAFWEKPDKMNVWPAVTVTAADTTPHTNDANEQVGRVTPRCFPSSQRHRRRPCLLAPRLLSESHQLVLTSADGKISHQFCPLGNSGKIIWKGFHFETTSVPSAGGNIAPVRPGRCPVAPPFSPLRKCSSGLTP